MLLLHHALICHAILNLVVSSLESLIAAVYLKILVVWDVMLDKQFLIVIRNCWSSEIASHPRKPESPIMQHILLRWSVYCGTLDGRTLFIVEEGNVLKSNCQKKMFLIN